MHQWKRHITRHCEDGVPLDREGDEHYDFSHITPGRKSNFRTVWEKGFALTVPLVTPMIGKAIANGALTKVAKHVSLRRLGSIAKKALGKTGALDSSLAQWTISKTGEWYTWFKPAV